MEYSLSHIFISECEGIKFRGCNFHNTNAGQYPSPKTIAIGAKDAGFELDMLYSNFLTGAGTQSTIEGYRYGVYSANYGVSYRKIAVRNTKFILNTEAGVSVRNNTGTQVVNNTFSVPAYESGLPQTLDLDVLSEGIYLSMCTGFKVEGNRFSSPSTTGSTLAAGIVISNAGENYNEIYRNTATNLNYGIQALGVNRSSPSLNAVGLKILCNDLSSNTLSNSFDISTPVCYNCNLVSTSGIGGNQSVLGANSVVLPAGNLFDQSKGFGPYGLYNADNPYNYSYNTGSSLQSPVGYTTTTINLLNNSNGAQCPEKYSRFEPVFPTTVVKANALAIKFRLSTAISSGAVGSSYDDQILVEYRQCIDSLVNYFMRGSDTVVYLDSVVDVLRNTDFVADYKLQLASLLMQMGQPADAYVVLDSILNYFPIDSSGIVAVNNIRGLYEIVDSLRCNGDNWAMLSTSQLALVHGMIPGGRAYGTAIAEALMTVYEDSVFRNFWVPLDTVTGAPLLRRTQQQQYHVANTDSRFYVYPNPAHSMIRIVCPADINGMRAAVVDVQGRIVKGADLVTGQNTIELKELPRGTYFIRLSGNGSAMEERTITLQ